MYYFALPALFFVNIGNTQFNQKILKYVFAAVIPLAAAIIIYILLYSLFKFAKSTLYLLILSTAFGSTAFFGIPFITFAFPGSKGESLAVLSAAAISIVGVSISITALELYKLEKSSIIQGIKKVAERFSRNPLILSILFGVVYSVAGVKLPSFAVKALYMVGRTTSTIAIFMLGLFLYGKNYKNIKTALSLSLLRIIFLPALAFILFYFLFYLPDIQRMILILMHSMPVAISMMVLSERYDFFKQTIASLLLISSVGSVLYLSVWLIILGVG
ncbi:MAG: AEC family transporter [Atribacterota bacterium]